MSWIKDTKFAAPFGGVTLGVALVLLYVGMRARTRYATALENYQNAALEVEGFEAIPLYPDKPNRAGKSKALNDYRTAITGMQGVFDKYRPKSLKNLSPQDFTDHAKAASEEVGKAFGEANTKLPEGFFLGFESYTGTLARQDATGLLDYQLGATKELMLALAKAGPSQLQNLHRPKFPEEDGEKWQADPNDASRPFPLEITFKGSERCLREFVSSMLKSPDSFYVVRSLRIMNEKPRAPLVADAKFETSQPGGGAGKPTADPFGGAPGFVTPPEEPAMAATTPSKPTTTPPKPATAPPKAAAPTPAAVATPAASSPAADSGRILNQVLGNEELQVFIHLDILQFLPVKPLPEVPKSIP
ncbi:MAG: Amuc_1100 family pilus-like protein [Verrucomicrobiota bacterium]